MLIYLLTKEVCANILLGYCDDVLGSIPVTIWYQLIDSYVRLIASILDGHQDNTNANIGIE